MRQLDIVHDSLNLRISIRCYKSLRVLQSVLKRVLGADYRPEYRALCHTTPEGVTRVIYTDAVPDWQMYALHEVIHAADHIMPEPRKRNSTRESEFRAYIGSGLYSILQAWHHAGCPDSEHFESPGQFIDAMDRGLTYVKP